MGSSSTCCIHHLLVVALLVTCQLALGDNSPSPKGYYKKKVPGERGSYGKPRHDHFGTYHDEHHQNVHSGKGYAGKKVYGDKLKPQKGIALAVEGVVECQNCKYVGTGSLEYSRPLAGAKVRLACRDMRYKTFAYGTAYTNTQGFFLIRIENFDFRKHAGVGSCKVYLVSSSNKYCSNLTDINSGLVGASLSQQKVYPDEILYSVGPFGVAPPSCRKASPRPPVYKSPPVYSSRPPTHHTSPSPSYHSPPSPAPQRLHPPPNHSPPAPLYSKHPPTPSYHPRPPFYAKHPPTPSYHPRPPVYYSKHPPTPSYHPRPPVYSKHPPTSNYHH